MIPVARRVLGKSDEITLGMGWCYAETLYKDKCATLDSLRERLSPEFTLDATWDLPFLIREHARKFQWSVAQATRWIRR